VTVKVNDESLNDLLPPKADSQLLGTNFLPQKFFSKSHLTAQFLCTLKFFFGDSLTWDDIFDRHRSLILPAFKTNPSPVSPKGEKLKPSSNDTLSWKTVTVINRPAPFPFGKGGGIGRLKPTIIFTIGIR
jgi:hypothetical protein